MDPNANLKEIRAIVRELTIAGNSGYQFDPRMVNRLVELVYSLDEWISQGGFMPKDWQK
jgi:hypothetical protein